MRCRWSGGFIRSMRNWYNRLLAFALALGVFSGASAQGPNDHIFPAAVAAKRFIDFDNRGFLINGQRTFLVSAGIEYARVPRALWADRLLRLKRAGFNCIEIYTFWNFHEPREGVFDFTGDHDLGAFLRLVHSMGLYAIVRVGPYYCAEWDNGGYPLWLKFKPGLRVREPNAPFEAAAGAFFDHLLPIVAANQIDRGGAVVLVQLENEHIKGWGTAMPNDYFRWLRATALAHGIDVPYFFSGLHHDSDPAGDALNLDDPKRPNPWMSTEFWSVWYNGYSSGPVEARLYERRTWKIIAHGGNGYNYYMAHGGSNFGYTNNDEDAASYDYGAAVGQGGDLRPIYYAFKRAAYFARSFASVLENSTGDTVRGFLAGELFLGDSVRANVRRGPAGEIVFLDNTSSSAARAVVGPDTVVLSPGEIFPYVRSFGIGGVTLTGNTLRLFGAVGNTILVYGEPGTLGRLHFSRGDTTVTVGPTVGTYHVGGLRVLVMSTEMADRTWVVDDKIICGPAYVGTFAGGVMETEGDGNALVYTASNVERYIGSGSVRVLDRRGLVQGWQRASGVAAAASGYDDSRWKRSERPLQMGADGDTTADAWYRVPLTVDSTGDYTLLVEGADRARAFLDGVSLGDVTIKDGAFGLRLTRGRHLLAVFTAHDGRDKLAGYLGPMDNVARKGLYGRALLTRGKPVVSVLSGWKMLRVSDSAAVLKGPPSPDAADWKSYTIGDDAFNKHTGYGWFQCLLPAIPAGMKQAELRFASVDENATVFVNGQRLARHVGWNEPFNVLLDGVDTFSRPVVLTVFVENYSNEGGIDQPVRFSPWVQPVEVRGWKMKGGPLSGRPLVSEGSAADTSGPCWWRASFRLPADSGWRPVWRVVPKGVGHGSVWVNGHNLGRYPEKIPVNGLYIPECWLRPGLNALLIFDEDGRDARQVTVEAEVAASRRVSMLKPSAAYGFVDPMIGTTKSAVYTRWGDEGGTYPGAVAPWGYWQLTPETRRDPSRGYDYRDSVLYVFSCLDHNSGFPGGSAGRFFIMPVADGSMRGGIDSQLMAGRPFRHEDEYAEPGYYRVRLADDGTVVEVVASPSAGAFRIRFGGNARAIFVGDTVRRQHYGFTEQPVGKRAVQGGMIYTFASPVVEMRMGISGDFDSTRKAVRSLWEQALGVFDITDDDARRKTVFYTALYHSLLVPWQVDAAGKYGGYSPWDSYRSLHPLLTLFYPKREQSMLAGLLGKYRQYGYLPAEPMTGNHSIPMLVDAWLKGIHPADKQELYTAMLRSLVRGPFLQADRRVYLDSGYIPYTYPESVTRTVEYGYDDWVLAQYARQVMGDTVLYRKLMRGATAWRKLLYVPDLLLLPRDGDSFKLHPGNSGYKEGDAWVYTYFAPQDIPGLIDRLGGPAYFSLRLDSALRSERIVFDNETVEHVPYLFAFARRPDLTRYWVRKIMDERYSDRPGGLPGNDDLGAMSSWYVFSALGFYPTCPGRPEYTLGDPVFRRVVVHLEGGKSLVITRLGNLTSFNGRPAGLEIPHAVLSQGGQLNFSAEKAYILDESRVTRFTISAAQVSAARIVSGEWNWIRYMIRNAGDTGVVHVVLSTSGKPLATKNLLVPAGATVQDSVAFRMYPMGSVVLRLGEVELIDNESLKVNVMKPDGSLPSAPTAEELGVRPVIRLGDTFAIRYVLKNTGWEKQTFSVPLLEDSAVVATDTLTLGPGEERMQFRVWKASAAGWHQWQIGGLIRRCRVYQEPQQAVVLDGGGVIGDTLMTDRSGWGNTLHIAGGGVPNGGQAVAADTRGAAVGRDRYLWVSGSPSLADLGEKLTMCVWVYPEAATGQGLVDIFTNGDTHVLQIGGGGSTLTFFAGGWGRGDCTVDLPANWLHHWHYLSGVCDTDGLTVYIDGQWRRHTPLEKGVHLFGGDNTWMLGRNEEFPGQRIFEGRVDRPMIVQEALDAGTIHALYLSGVDK